jgi:hypothetical protein
MRLVIGFGVQKTNLISFVGLENNSLVGEMAARQVSKRVLKNPRSHLPKKAIALSVFD